MLIQFYDHTGEVTSFAVAYDNQEFTATNGQADLTSSTCQIPDGTSCWARAHLGPNETHDSSDNFTYHVNDGIIIYYSLSFDNHDNLSFTMTM